MAKKNRRRAILFDGDIQIYQAASFTQRVTDFGDVVAITADKDEGVADLMDRIISLYTHLKGDEMFIALTDSYNFRKDILPTYKENRSGVERPILLGHLRNHLIHDHEAKVKEGLEGDDILGITATNPAMFPGYDKIIVSIDKDMRTIPGLHFNPDKDDGIVTVSEDTANYNHMLQTLMGDRVDGYTGCPGIGPKKAAKALEGITDPLERWLRVVEIYHLRGLTAEDALVQAQVARICQHEDFDYNTRKAIPWTPTQN